MVLTALNAFAKYGYESAFGNGTGDRFVFGKEQKVSGLTWMNNRQELAQLYTPEVQDFVFAKNEGKCSVEYVLSNPWIFSSILHNTTDQADVDSGESGAQPGHVWDSSPAINSRIRDIKTANLQFGYNLEGNSDDIERNAKGCVTTSLDIKASIDEKVSVSQNIKWGKEDNINTSITAPMLDDGHENEFIPYMFHHANIQLQRNTGALETIAQVQDFDITFDTGAELLYQVGTPDAVDAYRKLLKITGTVNLAVTTPEMLSDIRDRRTLPSLKMVFTNQNNDLNTLSGVSSSTRDGDRNSISTTTDPRSITIDMTRIGLDENAIDGFEPGEPIFENVNFQASGVTVTAQTGQTKPTQV